MKTTCPYCAEEIQAEAIKCKHCGTWIGSPAGQPGKPAAFGDLDPGRRLVRSTSDRMIAGICAGVGHYLGIDPTIVRVFAAVSTFFTAIFPGILIYIVLIFVIPKDDGLY